MAKLSGIIGEQYHRIFEQWPQFKKQAELNGYSTNDALARLIRRYLNRGFDDGESELRTTE